MNYRERLHVFLGFAWGINFAATVALGVIRKQESQQEHRP